METARTIVQECLEEYSVELLAGRIAHVDRDLYWDPETFCWDDPGLVNATLVTLKIGEDVDSFLNKLDSLPCDTKHYGFDIFGQLWFTDGTTAYRGLHEGLFVYWNRCLAIIPEELKT